MNLVILLAKLKIHGTICHQCSTQLWIKSKIPIYNYSSMNHMKSSAKSRLGYLDQAGKKTREPGNLTPSQLGTSRKDFGISRKDFGKSLREVPSWLGVRFPGSRFFSQPD